jgi:predicted transcriptional regulator
MGTTTLKIDPGLQERVKRLADTLQRTPHWLMQEAISDYVSRAEKRAEFAIEALNSLKEYQKTGLHLSGEELDQWLDTWGTDSETDAPVCHV